jgi:hypothetical protein
MDTAGFSGRVPGRQVRICGLIAGGLSLIVTLAAAAAPSSPRQAITNIGGELHGISAVSSSDAWAVGAADNQKPGLVLHWNGTNWIRVAVPVTGKGFSTELDGVSADSATDAWAVGMNFSLTRKYGACSRTVAVHWNGTGWTQAATPSPGGALPYDHLAAVTALSPGDAWAVGYFARCAHLSFGALILHWNGTAWTRVPIPALRHPSALTGVSALSSRDIWAVGSVGGKTLVLHWDGHSWTQVASPSPGAGHTGNLDGVSALSRSDVWAVGTDGGQPSSRSLVLHWNGTSWARVASPNPGGPSRGDFTDLEGVSAGSPSDAWAVGYYGHSAMNTVAKTLVLHWNGTSWAQVASPAVGSVSALRGVVALSSGNAWATGAVLPLGRTLVLHWNGTSWTRT